MPEWWEEPYPTGKAVGPDFPRNLYAEGNTDGRPVSAPGPDVIALKRAISRGGRWPWTTFNDQFTREFARGRPGGRVPETGCAGFQRQTGVIPKGAPGGQWGKGSYDKLRTARIPSGLPHAGEPLLDAVCVALLEEAVQIATAPPKPPPGPPPAEKVQAAIADYCRRSITNRTKIHYRQERPMRQFGIAPERGFTTDCSGHATSSYYWARQETKVAVPDPNGPSYSFNGYGYTGTLIGSHNPRVSAPYRVGDLALYGPSTSNTGHVCTCYQAGDASSSRWCSHGWEGDPSGVTLHYRRDFLCVVRPRLVP